VFNFFSKTKLFFVFLLGFNSYGFDSFIPDEIKIPEGIEKRTESQIKSIFLSLEKQYNNKTANLWRLKYHQALLLEKKDRNFFCETMKELSQISSFPLKSLSLIKSYSLCSFDHKITFDPSSFPDWLRRSLAKAFYERRKFFDDPEQTFKATLYLGEHSPYKEERISFLKHALFLTSSLKSNQALNHKKIQELLYKLSPSLYPEPQEKDYFVVAKDFKENRKFKQAISYYIKVLNSNLFSFDDKNGAFKDLGHIYSLMRNREKRIRNAQQWASWLLKENSPESLKIYYRKKLEIARQKWNIDENKKAIEILTSLLKEEGSKIIENEILFLRASVYLQEDQEELSLEDFNQVIENLLDKKNQEQEKVLSESLWKKAWIYRKRKEYKKSLENFALLKENTNNPYTYDKALFWMAKTYEDLGKMILSCLVFKDLVKEGPYGYYRLIAYDKLGKKIQVKNKENRVIGNKKDHDLIYWLTLFKENELIALFLEQKYSSVFNESKKLNLENNLETLFFLNKTKKYLKAFTFFNTIDSEIRKELINNYTFLLFPLDFYEMVKKTSQSDEISLAFLLSIIRQESAFNPRARSQADAFGLMQLIPSSALQAARENKIPYKNYKNLYNPSTNISLGSAHLKKLLRKYDNNFILVVAAYNAGGRVVDRWARELGHWSPLEFIENIPYEETRNYVRLVIRNYVFYHNLLSKNPEDWFPDYLLQEESLKKVFSKCF